jgi:NADH-quinone oxidoreductase subunit H
MKFAMFFLGEYTHMITTSFLLTILFFGGWHFPLIAEPGTGGVVVKLLIFVLKVTLFILFYMFVRWTIPRFRFDQLMGLAWKGLIPLSLANVVVVMCVRQWYPGGTWLLFPLSLVLLVGAVGLGVWWPTPARRSAPVTPSLQRP